MQVLTMKHFIVEEVFLIGAKTRRRKAQNLSIGNCRLLIQLNVLPVLNVEPSETRHQVAVVPLECRGLRIFSPSTTHEALNIPGLC